MTGVHALRPWPRASLVRGARSMRSLCDTPRRSPCTSVPVTATMARIARCFPARREPSSYTLLLTPQQQHANPCGNFIDWNPPNKQCRENIYAPQVAHVRTFSVPGSKFSHIICILSRRPRTDTLFSSPPLRDSTREKMQQKQVRVRCAACGGGDDRARLHSSKRIFSNNVTRQREGRKENGGLCERLF